MKRIAILLALLAAAFYGVWPAISLYQIHLALERGDGDLLARKADLGAVAISLARIALSSDAAASMKERTQAAVARPAALIELYARSQQQAAPLGEILAEIVRATPTGALIPTAASPVGAPSAPRATINPPAARPASPVRTLSQSEAEQRSQRQPAPAANPVRTLSANEAEQRAARTAAAHTRPAGRPVRTLSPEEVAAKQQGRRAATGAGVTDQPAANAADAAAAGGAQAPAQGRLHVRGVAPRGPLTIAIALSREAAAQPEMTAELAFRNFDWKLVRLAP